MNSCRLSSLQYYRTYIYSRYTFPEQKENIHDSETVRSVIQYRTTLGLPLGLDAPVMTPSGVIFLSTELHLQGLICKAHIMT